MDTVTFSLEELQKLQKKQLRILAEYHGLLVSGTKDELVQRLSDYYSPRVEALTSPDVDYGKILLPDETEDNPKYSARIRRIKWLEILKEKKDD